MPAKLNTITSEILDRIDEALERAEEFGRLFSTSDFREGSLPSRRGVSRGSREGRITQA